MESSLKSPALTMRVLKYAFVISAFLFIFVAIKIPAQAQAPVSQSPQLAIAVAGIISIEAGFFLPRFLSRGARRASQKNPALTPLKQWMTRGVVGLACFEACILYGFLLRFLGGHLWLVELLFGLGITAELFWSPGAPPSLESGDFPQS